VKPKSFQRANPTASRAPMAVAKHRRHLVKSLPTLTRAQVDDEAQLAAIVDEVARADPVARNLQAETAEISGDLRKAIDPKALATLLRFDETIHRRTAHLTVVIAQWAFWQGFSRGYDAVCVHRSRAVGREARRRRPRRRGRR